MPAQKHLLNTTANNVKQSSKPYNTVPRAQRQPTPSNHAGSSLFALGELGGEIGQPQSGCRIENTAALCDTMLPLSHTLSVSDRQLQLYEKELKQWNEALSEFKQLFEKGTQVAKRVLKQMSESHSEVELNMLQKFNEKTVNCLSEIHGNCKYFITKIQNLNKKIEAYRKRRENDMSSSIDNPASNFSLLGSPSGDLCGDLCADLFDMSKLPALPDGKDFDGSYFLGQGSHPLENDMSSSIDYCAGDPNPSALSKAPVLSDGVACSLFQAKPAVPYDSCIESQLAALPDGGISNVSDLLSLDKW